MELHILQRIIITSLVFLVLISCSKRTENKIKELQQENEKLKEQINYSLENERYKEFLISSIENELDIIDSGFIFLDIKNDIQYFDKQSLKISQHITNLKRKIVEEENKLNKSLSENKSLQIESQSLKKLLGEYMRIAEIKEKQILELRNKVKDQENIIELQVQELSENRKLIDSKNSELLKRQSEIKELERKIIKTEAETYDRLSNELSKTAAQLPTIKGWFTKREKEDIEALRTTLSGESQSYKTKANNLWKKYNE